MWGIVSIGGKPNSADPAKLSEPKFQQQPPAPGWLKKGSTAEQRENRELPSLRAFPGPRNGGQGEWMSLSRWGGTPTHPAMPSQQAVAIGRGGALKEFQAPGEPLEADVLLFQA